MAKGIEIFFNQLESKDDGERYNALQELLKITEEKVSWLDDYLDILLGKLRSENSYQRSIGMMILCNCAKSETAKKEYKKIIPLLMPTINDEKFITQRQYIQNIWKIAVVDQAYKKKIVDQLKVEYSCCINKPHYNLLRQDIIQSLMNIFKTMNDESIKQLTIDLIDKEEDLKNKKRYLKIL